MAQINISNYVSIAALYEGLAEEASELSAAALKASRVLRDENPTPVTYQEALKNVIEELSDLQNYLNLLYLKPHPDLQKQKMDRFMDRVREKYQPQKEDSNNDSGNKQ